MRYFMRKCWMLTLSALIVLMVITQTNATSSDYFQYNPSTNSWTVVCNHGAPGQAVSFLAVYGTKDQYAISEESVMQCHLVRKPI